MPLLDAGGEQDNREEEDDSPRATPSRESSRAQSGRQLQQQQQQAAEEAAARAQVAQAETARKATSRGAPNDLVLRTVLYTATAFHSPNVLACLLGNGADSWHGRIENAVEQTGAGLAVGAGAAVVDDSAMDEMADDGGRAAQGHAAAGPSDAAALPNELKELLAELQQAEAAFVSGLLGADHTWEAIVAHKEAEAVDRILGPLGAPLCSAALSCGSAALAGQAFGEAQSAVALCLSAGLRQPLQQLLNASHLQLGIGLVYNASRAHDTLGMAKMFLFHPRFRYAHAEVSRMAERACAASQHNTSHTAINNLLRAFLAHTPSAEVVQGRRAVLYFWGLW
jgi:hypothetical protein